MKSSSRSPPTEIPSRRPGVCRLDGAMVRFIGCACLLDRYVVWCRDDANSVQNHLKKTSSVQFICLIGSAASSLQFSSGRGGQVPPFSSFSSVQFIRFSSRTLPALVEVTKRPPFSGHRAGRKVIQHFQLYTRCCFHISLLTTFHKYVCSMMNGGSSR